MTTIESIKQNAEYVKRRAYQHCKNDHFREKVEELAEMNLRMARAVEILSGLVIIGAWVEPDDMDKKIEAILKGGVYDR